MLIWANMLYLSDLNKLVKVWACEDVLEQSIKKQFFTLLLGTVENSICCEYIFFSGLYANYKNEFNCLATLEMSLRLVHNIYTSDYNNFIITYTNVSSVVLYAI